MSNFFTYIGNVSLFIKEILFSLFRFYKYPKLIVEQINFIGIGSLPIICGTTIFTGAVTAYQAAFQGKAYLPDAYIGMSVIKAFLIELGPVLTALVVGGRAGSAMTAEIGSMRITEQIDALETLAIDPFEYLVVPRVIASTITVPLLTVVAELMGCIGGLLCSIFFLDIKPMTYIMGLRINFMPHELWGGLFKSCIFGAIIGIMGTYYGFYATGGTEGVGKATTKTVVAIFTGILIWDFIIAKLIFSF